MNQQALVTHIRNVPLPVTVRIRCTLSGVFALL